MADGPLILVSEHAIERARERLPGLERRDVKAMIFVEVRDALLADPPRMSVRRPRFLPGRRRKNRTKMRVRHVWPPAETHAYVIVERTAPAGDRAWIVTTTISAALPPRD